MTSLRSRRALTNLLEGRGRAYDIVLRADSTAQKSPLSLKQVVDLRLILAHKGFSDGSAHLLSPLLRLGLS